jgi:hypothetical protein
VAGVWRANTALAAAIPSRIMHIFLFSTMPLLVPEQSNSRRPGERASAN